jgi:hypothetical protein
MLKNLLPLLATFIYFNSFSQSIFEIQGPSHLCRGGTATLMAVNCSGSLRWSNNATSTTINVIPAETRTYYATCEVDGIKTFASFSPLIIPPLIITSSTSECLESGKAILSISNAILNEKFVWKKRNYNFWCFRKYSYPNGEWCIYRRKLQYDEWTSQHPYPTGHGVNDVKFNQNSRGVAVGEFGTIFINQVFYYFSNEWKQIVSGTKNHLNSVSAKGVF